mmetsp:Transcript_1215/g.2186  ORF Transcript_1215/g.2186 Transcript_1215/m.2186 type:complete len:104 (-) Transcript_1215:202-513(-)
MKVTNAANGRGGGHVFARVQNVSVVCARKNNWKVLFCFPFVSFVRFDRTVANSHYHHRHPSSIILIIHTCQRVNINALTPHEEFLVSTLSDRTLANRHQKQRR